MDKTAKILRENVSKIMDIWQNQVTKEVPASKEANAISLYDHLPNIIEDIADLMLRFNDIEDISKDEKYNEILENSKHHGRHRSSTAYYTVEQVVHEYIIFHRTLSDFLISRNGCNEKVSDLLKYVIETSILKSVGSFSRAIQEMQEKLIGTLAHDIRNPLSAAQLALEMMDKDEDQEWNDNLILASKRSVSKGLNLLEGLMDGITIKAGEGILLNFEAGDVLEHVKWVVTEAKEFYTNDILFECDEAQLLGVFDSTAVKRLLENLISNAVKYGSPRHPITISAKNTNNAVEIRVHNHGNPIPKGKQKQVFEFLGQDNQDKNAVRKSWGMGLALAQIVAEAHGGNISLKSDEASGTLFVVSLLKDFNQPGKRRTKLTFVEEKVLT